MEKANTQRNREKGFRDALKYVECIKSINLEAHHASMTELLRIENIDRINSSIEETLRIAKEFYEEARRIRKKYAGVNFTTATARRVGNLDEAVKDFKIYHQILCEYLVFNKGVKSRK